MWETYLACWCVAAIILVVPGMFVALGLRADLATSIMVAPLVSFASIGIIDIIYGIKGIECNLITVTAPAVVIGIVLCLLGRLFRVRRVEALSVSEELRSPLHIGSLRIPVIALALVLAVVTGVGVSLVVWMSSLGSPTDIVQNSDNAWHLWQIAHFMETGNHSSLYGGGTLLGGGFYPSAWHGLAALAGSTVGANAAIAEGASLLAVTSVAYPLSCVYLLSTLFGDKPRRVVLGSIFCLSIAFFPWRIMLWGPLYPNVVSFAVMSAEVALFVRLLRDARGTKERLLTGLFFVIGGVSLAIIQPNAIFSCGVFLIPFCLSWCRELVSERKGKRAGIIAELILLLAFAAIWLGLVYAPFMRSFVWYERNMVGDLDQSIKWVLALCFVMRRQQYVLGAVVLLGALALLLDKNRRWLVASYAFSAALYVVAYSIPAPLKNILTGFWYADHWRLASAACVFAMPLVACGLDVLVELVMRLPWWGKAQGDAKRGAHHAKAPVRKKSSAAYVVATVLVGCILVYNYIPLTFLPKAARCYAFDTVRHNVYTTINADLYEWAPLTTDEDKFLKEVKETVGDDKVINQPFDGSVFAYALYDIDVVYPFFGSGISGRAGDLKSSIDKISTDEKVQQEADEYQITYLLQLDQGNGPLGMNEDASLIDLGYDMNEWSGINSVRDDTPGFETVLSEGDKRLYKLETDAS